MLRLLFAAITELVSKITNKLMSMRSEDTLQEENQEKTLEDHKSNG